MSYKSPAWHPHQAFFSRRAPSSLRSWLTDRRSLTALLTKASHDHFTVQVLNEGWHAPLADEPGSGVAYIRQVLLLCNGQPAVFARTVIPRSSLTGELRGLTRLGNRPLGAVLFSNPGFARANLELAAIHPQTILHQLASPHSEHRNETLWGRRSIFTLNARPLLVNEIFLHDMKNLPINNV